MLERNTPILLDINVTTTGKYGSIKGFDVVVNNTRKLKSTIGHSSINGIEYSDVDSMIVAFAKQTDIKNVTKITTSTSYQLFLLLTKLTELNLIDTSFNPTINVKKTNVTPPQPVQPVQPVQREPTKQRAKKAPPKKAVETPREDLE